MTVSVEDLLGGQVGHCYGHTFSEPLTRLAFQRALAAGREGRPGTMVYGNTVLYDGSGPENYAALTSYLMIDIAAQQLLPSGHAVNPVPITEALRIPDIGEAIEAARLALRLIDRAEEFAGVVDVAAADRVAGELLRGAELFRDQTLAGLAEAGFDTSDAGELMLALRRIGPKTLERLFGPGAKEPGQLNGRVPTVPATAIRALERAADKLVAQIGTGAREEIRAAKLSVCLSATDVHEYGKILIGETLARLGVSVIDAGVHAEPDAVAALARDKGADFVAVSTYNGVALGYLKTLNKALKVAGVSVPILIGGRLNQLPDSSNTSLPVDVSGRLTEAGALVCERAEDMIAPLLEAARNSQRRS
jgi:methylmalonyl-CoA mutase cobalamin-binding subunit